MQQPRVEHSSPSPPAETGSPPQRKRTLSLTSETGSTASNKRAHSVGLSDSNSDLGASKLHLDSEGTSPTASPLANMTGVYPGAGDEQLQRDARGEILLESVSASPSSSTVPSPAATDSSSDEDAVPAYHSINMHPKPELGAQQAIVQEGVRQRLEAGDTWYLISRRWYRRWLAACSGGSAAEKDEVVVSADEIGPIDNADIVDDKGRLRTPVVDGVDVVVVPEMSFKLLSDWYGVEGPQFARPVISTVGIAHSERIEFYPPTFHLQLVLPSTSATSVALPQLPRTPYVSFPSSTTISKLYEYAFDQFHLSSDLKLRFWRLPSSASTEPDKVDGAKEGPGYIFSDAVSSTPDVELAVPISSNTETLEDALLNEQEVRLAVEQEVSPGQWLIEVPTPSSQRPSVSTPIAPIFGGPQFYGSTPAPAVNQLQPVYKSAGGAVVKMRGTNGKEKEKHGLFSGLTHAASSILTRSKGSSSGENRQAGLVGLQNLGNTCFMNSALQCMSNTKELQEYFLSGVYKQELNKSNPLGMGGQVALAFGNLLERLWSTSGSSTSYPPREFKQALAKFAPAFTGYGQQDSQELLAFLLDGTHEDLNRILIKPATEAPDWEGGGDYELVELAKTCWEQYRSRNDSVIVDLFQGQYKSTLVCPDCDKVSITFDPFMYVTTNLPINRSWTGKVFVVPADASRPRYSVELQVPKTATLKTAKNALGQLCQVDPRRLVVTEEWKSGFYKSWNDDDMITQIDAERDHLVFHELDTPFPQPRPRRSRPEAAALEADDEPIVIVVQNAIKRSASSTKTPFTSSKPRFYSSSIDNGPNVTDLFGSPFFVTLSKEEAKSERAIYKALVKQYARATRKGEEMLAWTDEEDEDALLEAQLGGSGQGPPPVLAPSMTGQIAPEQAVLPSTPPSEEVTMDVDQPSTSSLPVAQADDEPPKYQPTVEVQAPTGGVASPSAPAPIPLPATSAAQPGSESASTDSSLLFKMWVSEKRPTERQLPVGNDDVRGPFTVLSSRSKSSAASTSSFKSTFTSTSSSPKDSEDEGLPKNLFAPAPSRSAVNIVDPSISSSSASSDLPTTGEAPSSTTPSSAPEPAAPSPSLMPQLVRTGDFIVAEWTPASNDYFFGKESATWGETESLVDPALVAARARKGEKRRITIEDCIREFSKEERLGEDDMWYCPRCKKHQQATKKVEIWKAPDILVFALKRFSSGRYARDKIDDFVDFPVQGFDLSPYVEGDKVEKRLAMAAGAGADDAEPLIYDLYAVDNHYGGLGGGHYTAYAKNPQNEKWYEYDDSRVSPLSNSEEGMKTSAAYLLFYRRRTARPIGAKSRQLVDSAIQSRSASAANSDSGHDSSHHPGRSSLSAPSSRPGSSLGFINDDPMGLGGIATSSYHFSSGFSSSYRDDSDHESGAHMPGSYHAYDAASDSVFPDSGDESAGAGRGRRGGTPFEARTFVSGAASDDGAEPGSPQSLSGTPGVWSMGPSRGQSPDVVDVFPDDDHHHVATRPWGDVEGQKEREADGQPLVVKDVLGNLD